MCKGVKNLTIYVNKKFIDKHGTSIEFIHKDETSLSKEETIIRDFILRFPHIKVSIELEPQK